LAAVLLGTTGLVLTLSRGGWIGATLSGVALIFLAWRAKLISPKIPLALGALVILVGASFGPLVAERMLVDDQGSARARVPLMQIAGQMIKDHPYLGVGANNCSKVALDYAGRAAYRAEWFYTVHNKYLLVWVETGLLGLAAYVTFLFSTLRTGWRSWRTLDPVMAPIALAMTVAIAGQMCHMFVDIFNSRVQIQMLWLCAGLLVAISRLPKPQGSNLVANRESIPAPREPALAT
jgi:O-antigen ligase